MTHGDVIFFLLILREGYQRSDLFSLFPPSLFFIAGRVRFPLKPFDSHARCRAPALFFRTFSKIFRFSPRLVLRFFFSLLSTFCYSFPSLLLLVKCPLFATLPPFFFSNPFFPSQVLSFSSNPPFSFSSFVLPFL